MVGAFARVEDICGARLWGTVESARGKKEGHGEFEGAWARLQEAGRGRRPEKVEGRECVGG